MRRTFMNMIPEEARAGIYEAAKEIEEVDPDFSMLTAWGVIGSTLLWVVRELVRLRTTSPYRGVSP